MLNIKRFNNLINDDYDTKLTNAEIKQTSRDAILTLHQQTDYQKMLLEDIKTDIYYTNTSLKGISSEVIGQGETLNRVRLNIGITDTVIRKTDIKITQIQRKEFCHKLLLHILALLIFISIILSLIFKLRKEI